MSGRKVVSSYNMPTHLPLEWSVLAWLVLDHVHASGVIWGIVGTLLALVWIAAIVALVTEEPVELFKGGR